MLLMYTHIPTNMDNMHVSTHMHTTSTFLTTDSSCVVRSFNLTMSLLGCLRLSRLTVSMPGLWALCPLSIMFLTPVSRISFFCCSLDAAGGFSGMAGWTPSMLSQWAASNTQDTHRPGTSVFCQYWQSSPIPQAAQQTSTAQLNPKKTHFCMWCIKLNNVWYRPSIIRISYCPSRSIFLIMEMCLKINLIVITQQWTLHLYII